MKPTQIFVFLFIFIAISLTIAQSIDHECKDISTKSTRLRLKQYLFCHYDWTNHYSKNSNGTIVTMDILPRFATMDEFDGNLELNSWMYIVSLTLSLESTILTVADLFKTWNDEHLQWSPDKFDKVRSLGVISSEIWTPEIFFQNLDSGASRENDFAGVHCTVYHTGNVGCAPRYQHIIACQTDYTLWPYDRHTCTLVMSSLSVTGGPIVFQPMFPSSKTVSTDSFETTGQWEITVTRVEFEQSKSNSYQLLSDLAKVSVDFTVDRAHSHLRGKYIMPAIITTVMSLTTVWLDPRLRESLVLACLNPVIHLLCIHDLNWLLPHGGNSVPNIVLFYTSSLVLVIVALLATVFLSKLRDTEDSVPQWISSSMSSILENKVGQILLLGTLDPKASADLERQADEDRDVDLVNSEPRHRFTWNHFAIFLGWIIFFGFLLTYAVMWATLMPSSSMKSPVVDVSERRGN